MHHARPPRRVIIDGRPHWKFDDGHVLPVVSGGATDDGGDDGDDGDGDDGDGTGDGSKPAEKAVDHAAEAAKWRAMARKHETQAKANAEAAKELDKLKNAGKTEAERQAALIAELQSRERTATVKALKLSVAAEKGLSPEQAKFLPDLDDEVDMLAAADSLLEAFGSAAKGDQSQPTRQPKSNLTNPLGDDDAATKREALINSMMGKAAL